MLIAIGAKKGRALALFDDGNGRIARAIGDLLLVRTDGTPQRFYSFSAQIQREHKAYYDILERTQKGTLDVTAWLAGSSIARTQPSKPSIRWMRFWS